MAVSAHSSSISTRWHRAVRNRIPTVVTIMALLAIWQVWVAVAHPDPALVASPTDIAASIARTWPTLGPATWTTAYEGLCGFLIAVAVGIPLGVAVFRSSTVDAALMPPLTAAQTLPLIAITPLLLIWFGFEPIGKIVIVAVFALFPIAVQTVRGLRAVPSFYADVALTCGATPRWTLWHVQLRVAARQVFGGIRVSAAYVFATAATAEYLGARSGLGIWLQSAYNSFQTPLIFAAAVMIMALTGVLMLAVHAVERCVLGAPDSRENPDADE
ncbi:ABC transporter permease [Bifidobacterium pseudolongum subsp. globosum]|uniref:ABC transporter permease n=1 Tax=Bifidobacterium pseudolongum subsp. globosum TaxID=1690 RepID=A0A4Q4ZZM5_9BIFI|nr:ABC transporter permease [Bifidobacterium pseudolongum subsp. globosum]